MVLLFDYATGSPGAAAIKAAGGSGAIRYLCNSPDRGLNAKMLMPGEIADFKANGLEIVSNWQLGKGDTADFKGGFDAGVKHGRIALSAHRHLGGTGFRPIYFSIDEDVNLDTWNSLVLPYLNGVASVIGKEWVGVYGGQRSMWWADDDGFKWRWQTLAWSRYDAKGNWNNDLPVQWVDGVQIRQYEVDKFTVGNKKVDRNSTHAADYGQWSLGGDKVPAPAPPVIAVPTPEPEDADVKILDRTANSPNQSSRFGARVRLFVLHTQEGNGNAQSLADFLLNPNSQVSYHWTSDNGTRILVVPRDRAAWAVLDANSYTLNWCFGGSSVNMSRQQWIDNFGVAIDDAAKVFTEESVRLGLQKRTVSWDEISQGQSGATDHLGITKGLRIGSHTDVGPNFPWDRFVASVNKYLGRINAPAPKPVVNLIDQAAAKPENAWLGARKPGAEKTCGNDGKGRFAEFANGNIYFHQATGTFAVSNNLMEKWGSQGYERGDLGYPINNRTILKDGEVQGFERGAIYRKNGQPAFILKGLIREAWNRADFETGVYGYPTSDEFAVPGTPYLQQNFEKAPIYFTPTKTIGILPTAGVDTPAPEDGK